MNLFFLFFLFFVQCSVSVRKVWPVFGRAPCIAKHVSEVLQETIKITPITKNACTQNIARVHASSIRRLVLRLRPSWFRSKAVTLRCIFPPLKSMRAIENQHYSGFHEMLEQATNWCMGRMWWRVPLLLVSPHASSWFSTPPPISRVSSALCGLCPRRHHMVRVLQYYSGYRYQNEVISFN